MTASDLLSAHLALPASRPDEDAFYQGYASGSDTAPTELLPILPRILAWAASFPARRITVVRTR